MTRIYFDNVVQDRLTLIKGVLASKQEEYARGDNPMHNFEKGAQLSGNTREEVLDGFLLKHLISYKDMMQDLKDGKCVNPDLIQEKFGDIINYFILQEAQFKDTSQLNYERGTQKCTNHVPSNDDDDLPF